MTVYDFAYAVGIGVTSPIWFVVPKLRTKVLDALRERKGEAPKAHPHHRTLLIHAVSLGEINATPALVRVLSEAAPSLRFLVSTTSRTGQARAKQLYEKNPRVTLVRFPFDFSSSVIRLLQAQQPLAAVLMELEIWPNFMRECGKRGIPVVLINGRLSESSYGRYRMAGMLTRPMFSKLSSACVQEPAYAKRFAELGVPADRISVTGTMKFDTAQLGAPLTEPMSLAEDVGLFPGVEKIWVCGSTGPGEEPIVLDAYKQLRRSFPTLRLAIIPRHPERFNEVADLIRAHGFGVVRRSKPQLPAGGSTADKPVVLGDTMGELRKFYQLADVVFVGRTLVDLGSKQHGSDMIEPAALAKPVVVGPYTGNFREVMNRFRQAKAMREAASPSQLRPMIAELLLAPIASEEMGRAAQEVVKRNQGATARHAQVILDTLRLPATPIEEEIEIDEVFDPYDEAAEAARISGMEPDEDHDAPSPKGA